MPTPNWLSTLRSFALGGLLVSGTQVLATASVSLDLPATARPGQTVRVSLPADITTDVPDVTVGGESVQFALRRRQSSPHHSMRQGEFLDYVLAYSNLSVPQTVRTTFPDWRPYRHRQAVAGVPATNQAIRLGLLRPEAGEAIDLDAPLTEAHALAILMRAFPDAAPQLAEPDTPAQLPHWHELSAALSASIIAPPAVADASLLTDLTYARAQTLLRRVAQVDATLPAPQRSHYEGHIAVPLSATDALSLTVEGQPTADPLTITGDSYGASRFTLDDTTAQLMPARYTDRDPVWRWAVTSSVPLSPTPLWVGAFQRPVKGPISQGFGVHMVVNGEDRGQHLGIDYDVPEGTLVAAPADGRVIVSRDGGKYGHMVVIDHGAGVASNFWHLRSRTVAEGDLIAQGDPIGLVGDVGVSTGSHLHFGMAVDGLAVDPTPWLQGQFQ